MLRVSDSPVDRFLSVKTRVACVGLLCCMLPGGAFALDWSKATARDIALFLPGQTSWEQTLTAASHKGAAKIRSGQSCNECHAEEEADMGTSQAAAVSYRSRPQWKEMFCIGRFPGRPSMAKSPGWPSCSETMRSNRPRKRVAGLPAMTTPRG